MSHARQALVVHPAAPDMTEAQRTALSECIDAALACTQACTTGADSCLEEPGVAHLTRVIRAQLNCAAICSASAQILSRFGSDFGPTPASVLRALDDVSALCEDVCRVYAGAYPHCRVTADSCTRVRAAAAAMLALD
ncbi:four-helix bundle copper-binding protein [Sinomonas atrocyanea]|uniref:four-helix bundle copper-binding protein n=1 Tax=Sinomonas atrocyanea TaxID=37927 RepID=UPI00278813EC|nr:four-helix bundle copper-binding protein [Sinomonas atrocyanea]MDQ0260897.1 uroporphyrinogen-III synthase [Sinomonas atrocyanea]MDR6622148.1 uroporphyrinogen-III synthase [Sinomonas atrocyanea]